MKTRPTEELPPYLYCDDTDCYEKHFLTLNQDIQGNWVIGYMEFIEGGCIAELAINNSVTIEEAIEKMKAAYKIWISQK